MAGGRKVHKEMTLIWERDTRNCMPAKITSRLLQTVTNLKASLSCQASHNSKTVSRLRVALRIPTSFPKQLCYSSRLILEPASA